MSGVQILCRLLYVRDSLNTYTQILVICNSLGYFLYDSVLEAYYDTLDFYIILHHMAACWGLFFVWIETHGASVWTLVLFLSEITTPLYITKWGYDRMDIPRNSFKYQIVVLIYSFMFVVSRAIIMQYLSYHAAISIVLATFQKGFLCMNMYVFHTLLTSLFRLIWNFIPNWYEDPESIQSQAWWIAGKNIFGKYTKDTPWKYYYYTFLVQPE